MSVCYPYYPQYPGFPYGPLQPPMLGPRPQTIRDSRPVRCVTQAVPKQAQVVLANRGKDSLIRGIKPLTIAHGSPWLYWINQWTHWQDLAAAALQGGSKGQGVFKRIYQPHTPWRTYFIDPVSIMGCAWDGINAYMETLVRTKSPGTAFVAGLTEAASQFGFGYYFAEHIMYPIIEGVGKLLPKVASRGWGRSLIGGTVSLVAVESMMRLTSRLVLPVVSKTLGPMLDD